MINDKNSWGIETKAKKGRKGNMKQVSQIETKR